MATVNIGTFASGPGVGLDMLNANIGQYAYLTLTTRTDTLAHGDESKLGDPRYVVDFYGSAFTYDTVGNPTGGTINRIVESHNGQVYFDVSNFAVSVPQFLGWVQTSNTAAAFATILSGNDVISGNSLQDIVSGFAGNDAIYGNGGNDYLEGNLGNDTLDGGSGFDTAVYSAARANYDIVTWAGTTGVISKGGTPDGVDKLVGVEQLYFFADRFINTPAENFRPLDYIASYADLSTALGTNASAGFDHYLFSGAREGRVVTFNGLEYIASYSDLMNAFGASADAGAAHYIQAGRFEGRHATFDSLAYLASYTDLMNAFGSNADAGASHYIQGGRFEGRHPSFDGLEYIASYGDLIKAFGSNVDAATTHYITNGRFEGRHVTFDGLEYIASYGDLINAFHTQVAANPNPDIGANHYIAAGHAEHRAPDQFDAAQYLANYADLQAAFGHNTEAATLHYITTGYFEHRTDQ
jgi:serralysin